MSLRTIASFAIAIFLGLMAVLLLRGYLGAQRSAPSGGANTTPVVVAAAPVARGTALQPAMLKIVDFPSSSVPQGSYQTVQQVVAANGPARIALGDIVANEPVVAGKITGPGARPNLAGQLTPGTRAVSIRTSDVSGVGGFVLPGDRVDVLLTRTTSEGAAAQTVVQMLAENILVLAVDQSDDAQKPTVAKAVTLEVTPEQSQSIPLALAIGQVSLALRQSADGTPVAKRLTTIADLGGVRPQPIVRAQAVVRHPVTPTAPPPPPLPQIRVTRGVEIVAYAVPG